MSTLVVQGPSVMCSLGSSPSKLSVAPTNTYGGLNPAATVHDMKPGTNLAPFGMLSVQRRASRTDLCGKGLSGNHCGRVRRDKPPPCREYSSFAGR